MATIQDIFDWLNQGAQGDIPGTGGGEPNAGAPGGPLGSWMRGQGMDPAMKGYDWGGVPTQRPWLMSPQQPANEAQNVPMATPAAATQGVPTPEDYAGHIPPPLLSHYHALVKGGLPPSMAHMILTQPSEFAGLFSEGGDADDRSDG